MTLPIVPTWSFLNALDNCPHKAAAVYVDKKIPFVRTSEMAWGDDVHKGMENRIRHGSPLPDTMQAAEAAAKSFHDMSKYLIIHVEYQLAMLRDGKPCDYHDKTAFYRSKLDCVVLNSGNPQVLPTNAWMVDWKTGNVREDPFELQTHALLLKVHYPHLGTIQGEYFWMKTGQNGLRYTFNNHSPTYERMIKLVDEAATYLRAGEWPKRKNPLCGWCPVKDCENWYNAKAGQKPKRN